jgi:hypothetical protein
MLWPDIEAVQIVVSLRRRSRSRLFLLVVGCASLVMAAETLLVGVGSMFRTPRVGWGLLALDRNDPWVENRLGKIYQQVNLSEGLRHLRRATQLSPYRQLYWSDLERACEFVRDQPCVDEANERLLQLCPMAPYYHLLAVQRLLRGNELDAALEQSRRLLELDPTYAPTTWQCLQSVGKPESVYQKVLAESGDIQLKIGYVDFLSGQGDNDNAYQLWKLSVAGARPFLFATAAPYLDRLIGLRRIEEASHVWRDLGRLGILTGVAANDGDNLIFNGDFEQPPLAAGFDWRTGPTTYVNVDFASAGAYHGGHCLRLDFLSSRNDEYVLVYQIVPVLPQNAYRLEAFVRTADITSDSGPRLCVSDMQASGFPDAISETTVGTTPWHPVRLSFTTGPRTQAVRILIWRPRSRVFPMEISGTCWWDAVILKSAGHVS